MKQFRSRPNLSISWTSKRISLLLSGKSGDLKQESFALEPPDADLNLRIRAFLGSGPRPPAILTIPRSKVLQKEMALAREGLKENLEAKVAQFLP